jgi:broad-specificity NMP kinase
MTIIKKETEIVFDLKVTCRRCEKTMPNTASVGEKHLYFACPDCNIVVVIDLELNETKIDPKKKRNLFDAFTKGFLDGMLTIVSVFDIPEKDVKEKLHSKGLVSGRIHELYQLWMGF